MSHSHVVVGSTSQRPPILEKKPSACNGWLLLDAEKIQYGDRCPKGFTKLELLGKGGCAIVWLAKDNESGQRVALK